MCPKFEERPYWRPNYAGGIGGLLEVIPTYFERSRSFIKDPVNEEFVNGFIHNYRTTYITECNRGEKTGTQKYSDTEASLNEKLQCAASSEELTTRNRRKSQNLLRAIEYIFGKSLCVETLKHAFDVDLAKQLNELIGEDLFANAGCYRRTNAKPSSYDYLYLPPQEIEESMNELFENVHRELGENSSDWFEIAAKFFERFLMIHPFPNGNGRTARILLSALLIKYTIVPVSLFSSSFKSNSNEVYLTCLDEAHNYGNYHLLSSLIIESTHRSLHNFVVNLDIFY